MTYPLSYDLYKKIEEIRCSELYLEKEELFDGYLSEVFDEFSTIKQGEAKECRVMARQGMQKFLWGIPLFISNRIFSSIAKKEKDYILKEEFKQWFHVLKYEDDLVILANQIFNLYDFDLDESVYTGDMAIILEIVDAENFSKTKSIKGDMDYESGQIPCFHSFHHFNRLNQSQLSTRDLDGFYIDCDLKDGALRLKDMNKSITFYEFLDLVDEKGGDIFFTSILKYFYQNVRVLTREFNLNNFLWQIEKNKSAKDVKKECQGLSTFELYQRDRSCENSVDSSFSTLNIQYSKDFAKLSIAYNKDNKEEIGLLEEEIEVKQTGEEGLEVKSTPLEVSGGDFLQKIDQDSDPYKQAFLFEYNFTTNLESINRDIAFEGDLLYGEIDEINIKLTKKYFFILEDNLYIYTSNDKLVKYEKFHELDGSTIRCHKLNNINGVELYSFTIFFRSGSIETLFHEDPYYLEEWMEAIKENTKYKNFFDSYEIYDQFDNGSYGKVHKIMDTRTSVIYAAKVLEKNSKSEAKTRNEIDLLKFAQGEHIVKYIEHYENYNYKFIVMEYLDSGNLCSYIMRKRLDLTEDDIASIGSQIALAILSMHAKGIIHRDIKPENVLVEEFSTLSSEDESISKYCAKNIKIKLSDFGFATILGEGKTAKEFLGTLPYMAPEIHKNESYGKPVDIWSFGVTLYFIIYGLIPFYSISKEETINNKLNKQLTFPNLIHSISRDAKDLIMKCLEKDPKERITIGQIMDHPWISKTMGKKV